MWIECETCEGFGVCPDTCCDCEDCGGHGGADWPDTDPDF